MKLSLLQLNTNSDNYWDKLTSYLTSPDFDILQLQELTGKETFAGNLHSRHNTFAELQKILQDKYYGVLSIAQRYTSSPNAYLGNGTFYKKEFALIDKKELVLFSHDNPFRSDLTTFEEVGRTVLHLTFAFENKHVSFLNTHLAWAKTSNEEPHQTKQGAILVDYLRTVPEPFVLTGDFNLTPDQPLVQKINKLAHNLTTENQITNTLDPKNHRAKILFPKGLAVDYIFTSKDVQVNNFAVVDEDLSDHLGLKVEIEI